MTSSVRILTHIAVVLTGVVAAVAMQCAVPRAAGDEKSNAADANPVDANGAAEAIITPKAVDLRPLLQKWGLEPRVQGGRETCSVFVVTEALEYALASKQQRGTRLSAEFLNWAGNQTHKESEDGGCFSELWAGYESHGICAEAEMPYRDKFDPAAKPSDGAIAHAKEIRSLGLKLHWIKEWDADKGVNEKQLAEIKKTLAQQWPVSGGFLWPKSKAVDLNLLTVVPRSEVIDGHSVLLVGYRDDAAQPGGGVFVFRNTSHGGRDGWMPYAYAREFVNDAAWVDDQAR